MARYDMNAGTVISVGHRNAVICRYGKGAGDPGNDLKRYPVFRQQFQFFASPPEQERIAAFQPYNVVSSKRFVEQHSVRLLLGKEMMAGPFAGKDPAGLCGDEIQDLLADERIVNDYVRLQQYLSALDRKEPRIAGSRSYEPDFSFHRSSSRVKICEKTAMIP